MAFLVYEWDVVAGRFANPQSAALAGNTGPLCAAAQAHIALNPGPPVRWHARESALLRRLGHDPSSHALFTDVNPNSQDRIEFYRFLDVWGFTYEDWTPIAVRLRQLYARAHSDPAAARQAFAPPPESGPVVVEFLYLQGGTNGGTWNWGSAGSVNGALLFPDAWEYFVAAIQGSK